MHHFKLPAGYTAESHHSIIDGQRFIVRAQGKVIFDFYEPAIAANSREALAYHICTLHDQTYREGCDSVREAMREIIGAASPGDITAATYTGR